MKILLAWVLGVAVLSGCGTRETSVSYNYTHAPGVQSHASRVVSKGGVARFACLSSSSGRCHYRIYPRDCAGAGTAPVGCEGPALQAFVVSVGRSHPVQGLPKGFRTCSGAGAERANANCS